MNPSRILIMAAGLGTRMKSRRAKVLHELAGRPLIGHVLRTALGLSPDHLLIVVGHQAEIVEAAVREQFLQATEDSDARPGLEFVAQREQRGTGHALMCAEDVLEGQAGTMIVLSGDVPLVRGETLRALFDAHQAGGFAASVLTVRMPDPTGYGRIVRDAEGGFERIVEHRDATADELALDEINSGIYAFELDALLPALKRLTPANAQGEYYLTDVLGMLKREGRKVGVVLHGEPDEILGINSRVELASAARKLRRAKLDRLMRDGVTIIDPDSAYIDLDARIGIDTVVGPNVVIEGRTVIGEDCRIMQGAHLVNARLGDQVTVREYSVLYDSTLDEQTSVGPFAHLRMNAHLHQGAVVGNFVEVKKSTVGRGSKAMHLTYLGDATLGERVNIGAGTVTCNYDGKTKHPTVIEDGVKIGSDTMLVAPVRVGRNSVTGAGSVVTRDVPENTLVAGVPAVKKKGLE